jgi:hypothetical protein
VLPFRLNHHADLRIVPRGHSLFGSLLALGTQPIPEEYAHGATIPAVVAVINQSRRRYTEPVSLWCDRGEQFLHAARKFKPILECRDPVPRKR